MVAWQQQNMTKCNIFLSLQLCFKPNNEHIYFIYKADDIHVDGGFEIAHHKNIQNQRMLWNK